ncbi:unnamed protein product [Ceratitis capitata]|uniref:(Mediterranean fruit fly) hypothetical protein n=1 Tax=Ceratitis capitata TaxID=7213 RepID=A0A811UHD1_CERCA|nr:unnamed protein product [Ceratitis capitata]
MLSILYRSKPSLAVVILRCNVDFTAASSTMNCYLHSRCMVGDDTGNKLALLGIFTTDILETSTPSVLYIQPDTSLAMTNINSILLSEYRKQNSSKEGIQRLS